MLEDVRVLDLSTGIAGPYCTKLLADAGADVVKVEPPEGDPLRRWRRGEGDSEDSPLFRFLNASKRSIIGNLGDEEVGDLAARADLLVESLSGSPELGPLRESNPQLVVTSITPFGRTGPWANKAATEFTLQGWCGSLAARGTPDRPPLAAGGRIGEWAAGSYAAVGSLGALWGAQRYGRGEHVDVAVLDCMCVTMNTYAPVFASFLGGHKPARPTRSIEIPSIEPTADGYVGFCTITAQQFQDFLVLIERPDLIEDRELAGVQGRARRREEILGIIHAWTTRHTTAEVIEAASLLRIPVAPIGNGEAVLSMEQFLERGVFVEHPGGDFLQPRVPYRVSGREPRPFTPAPAPGEHTHKIAWQPRPATPEKPAKTAEPEPAPAGSGPAPELPLEGVRIIDFTAFWAGPSCTHVLAALGADVIKVESVQRPDGMRFTTTAPPSVEQWWEWGPVFHGANAGKRSVTIDMTRPEGLDLAKRLIAGADAMTENFSPRVIESFGLDWETVHSVNPRAVMLRMPAFGLDGPWRDRTGFAQTMEQVSGMAWVTGWEDGAPLIPRGPCDPIGGMHAAFALMLAVREARRTGEGFLVEVTLVEAALNAAAEQVVEFTRRDRLLGRAGNRGPGAAPQGLYACRGEEEWLALSVESDEQWGALRIAMGHPEWADDARLASAEGRQLAHDLLDEKIGRWCADRELDEVVRGLSALGIPVAAVVDAVDIVDNPQLRARGLFEALEHPVAGKHEIPGIPFRFATRKAGWLRWPPPTLGQHNDEILGDLLRLSTEDMAKLRESKVVGERPLGA